MKKNNLEFDEALIKKYEKMIRKLIHKIKNQDNRRISWRIDDEDLLQECLIIMGDCVAKFDDSKGVSFTTYLYTSCQHRIHKIYMDSCRPTKIGAKMNKNINKYRQLDAEGYSYEEIREIMSDVNEKDFLSIMDHLQTSWSIDQTIYDDENILLDDGLMTKSDEFADILEAAILDNSSMSDIEKTFLCETNGLFGVERFTIAEFAKKHKLSPKKMNSVKLDSMIKLKRAVHEIIDNEL